MAAIPAMMNRQSQTGDKKGGLIAGAMDAVMALGVVRRM
jgi:acyl-coenzyme A thioesterase PaaI-like protein